MKNGNIKSFDALAFIAIFLTIFISDFGKFGTIWADSPSYINNSIFVPPLYPIIIDIFQYIFGEQNLKMVAIGQFCIGSVLLFWALLLLSDQLKLSDAAKLLLMICIFSLYQKYSYKIMTEAFSFPLFYLYLAYSIKVFSGRKISDFYFLIIIAVTTCLIRAQLLSIIIMLFLELIILGFIAGGKFLRPKVYVLFIVALIVLFTFNGTANYIIKGKYASFLQSGLNFIATASYTAKPEQVALFKDQLTKNIFSNAIDKLQQRNALMYCNKEKWHIPEKKQYIDELKKFDAWDVGQHEGSYEYLLDHFALTKSGGYHESKDSQGNCRIIDINHIANTGIERESSFLQAFSEEGINDYQKINMILMDISTKLIKANFYDWMISCLMNFYKNLGNVIFIIMIFFMLRYFRLWYLAKKGRYKFNLFDLYIAFIILFHLMNSLFVSFTALYVPRYAVYADTAFGGIIIVMLVDKITKFVNLFYKQPETPKNI